MANVDGAAKAAATVREEESLDVPQVETPGDGVDEELLVMAWVDYEAARRSFEDVRSSYEARLSELEQRESELKDKETAANQRDVELARLDERISERDAELMEREEAVLARELDADEGFVARRRQWREDLESQRDAIFAELREDRERWEAERTAALKDALGELDTVREELATRQAEREQRMAEREAELDMRANTLRIQDRELRAERAVLDFEREDLEAEVGRASDEASARREASLTREQARAEALLEQLQRQESQIVEYEARDRRFGHRTVEDVESELRGARERIEALSARLASLPSDEEAVELRQIALDRQRLDEERTSLLEQKLRLQGEVDRLRQVEHERNLAEQQAHARGEIIENYEQQVNELRVELRQLIDQKSDTSPFQVCSQMDHDPELQSPSVVDSSRIGLADLVNEIRQRIASDGLFYDAPSLRAFLGGMAMSPLHILQGISGTGKTSLPKAVAKALGASCGLVEVQAGWRDRQDLLGYYNPFEHRFVEQKLLTYLYEAQTPKYRDLPYFIVLDEMNLSHPEQYFADFLSQLEQPDPNDRWVKVMNHRDSAAPAALRGGVDLRVPPNVWFVGTANHDETTVSFAPKTYDRAHVMELPDAHPAPIEVQLLPARDPVGMSVLETLFDSAADQNEWAFDLARGFLEDCLGPTLRGEFEIGWGNRLVGQLRRYVPVIVAADGDIGEAVDQFLAYKVLYKLRNRFEFSSDQIDGLIRTLDTNWVLLEARSNPHLSRALLEREAKRLGG